MDEFMSFFALPIKPTLRGSVNFSAGFENQESKLPDVTLFK
jgi:hypothetical protein